MLGKIGAIKVIIIANVIVTFGCLLQAIASGQDQMWILCIARFIIGFGGLCTPFTTLEVLLALYPDDFMFMAGVRNLIQSASGFICFILLPLIHQSFLKDESMADGSLGSMQVRQRPKHLLCHPCLSVSLVVCEAYVYDR